MGVLLGIAAALLPITVVLLVVLLRVLLRGSSPAEAAAPEPVHVEQRLEEQRAQELRAEEQRAEQQRAEVRAAERDREQAQVRRLESERVAELAAADAAEVLAQAHQQAAVLRQEASEQATALQTELERREARLTEREQRADQELVRAGELTREAELAREAAERAARELVDLETERARALADLELERAEALEQVAEMTRDQAKAELKATVEQQAKREAALTVRQIEAEARENGESRARAIVTDAVQRVASEQTAESVVSVLHLPSDDMKGRIIGREGRNIRAFEQVTGVNVVIDDTPEAVLLSCFDPVRREVGRVTLEKLILDGRIHPHRIEEIHEQAKAEVEAGMLRAGEDALVEAGLTDVHPELVTLLGRLRFRTSYGQNVLKHLIETAHIASHMASEIGVDPTLVKRGAFFHDIGKALTHEVEGSHALIGADLARRYGEREEVVHAIEAHHGEVPPETVEAVLTQASDSCSGGRPGARRDSLEVYVQRLERIEEIASSKRGVDRVFAMQAGREVRVMVQPDEIDDLEALVLAREVAKQIEDELTYPGQIRVTVVRESRATEIAH